MKKVLAAALFSLLLSPVAKADLVLQIGALPNPVPQSLSNPCIICGTNASAQPVDFGYNNFTSQNLPANMFPKYLGGIANGDEVDALPYAGRCWGHCRHQLRCCHRRQHRVWRRHAVVLADQSDHRDSPRPHHWPDVFPTFTTATARRLIPRRLGVTRKFVQRMELAHRTAEVLPSPALAVPPMSAQASRHDRRGRAVALAAAPSPASSPKCCGKQSSTSPWSAVALV